MGKFIAIVLIFALSVAMGYIYADEVRAFNDNLVDTVIETVIKINPPKDTDILYERVSSAMAELSIYRTDATAHMKQYSEDTEIVTEIIDQTINTRFDEEDFYFLTVQEVEITAESVGYESYSKSVYAYENGKAYIAVGTDGVEQRLYAPMDKTEFMDFIGSDSSEFDILSASNKAFSYLKDERKWVISLSEYSYEDIVKFGEPFFGADIFDETELLDVNIEICVNQNFLVTDMKVEFIFAGTEEEAGPGIDFTSDDENEKSVVPLYSTAEAKVRKPELSINYKYLYSEDNVRRVELEYDKYNEVDDLSVLKDYGDFMNDIINAKDQSAHILIDTTYRFQGTEESYKDECVINYGEGKNGFFFSMDFSGDVGNYELNYLDGYLMKTQNGSVQYDTIDEIEAKLILESYMTCSWYKRYRVTDIEVIGQDMYRLILNVDPEDLLGADTASQVMQITNSITVCHKDGDISLLTSEISIKFVNGEVIEEIYTIDYEYGE